MPLTSLFDGTVAPDHLHVEEDLSDQADGYRLVFNTNQIYIPDSIIVIYSGVSYTKDNDFFETGPQEFTLINDDPFPPEAGRPLFITYRRRPT
jgi:hypothetical protein